MHHHVRPNPELPSLADTTLPPVPGTQNEANVTKDTSPSFAKFATALRGTLKHLFHPSGPEHKPDAELTRKVENTPEQPTKGGDSAPYVRPSFHERMMHEAYAADMARQGAINAGVSSAQVSNMPSSGFYMEMLYAREKWRDEPPRQS